MSASETDVANRALSAIGTRSSIASLDEDSNEARQCKLLLQPTRDQLLRMAPWNCARTYNNLSLICAASGTPENPSQGTNVWEKGIPPPGWAYEYAYPADCLRPCWIVPQFSTGFASGIPITTAVTGGAPSFWNGPPARFAVGIDQVTNGVPAVGGEDTKVIWTNQEQAILSYVKRVTNPAIWDDLFTEGLAEVLASKLAIALTGDKALANLRISLANDSITKARVGDGNEGLTVNDVTPDWIRVRGVTYDNPFDQGQGMAFDWGPLLSLY